MLEHRRPAGTRTSLRSPPGGRMRAPPPPFVTPASADPSDQTHTASSGSSRMRSSAAARRTCSGAVRPARGPRSRWKWTAVLSSHGGRVWWRRASTGTSTASAALSASAPISLHPVVVFSRRGGLASPTVRSGSPPGRDAASPTILAASTCLRESASAMPASDMRAWTGVEAVQPVTARAAARSSRSTSSRWLDDAADIQAAAAYSSAPRTYPLATVRSCFSSRPHVRPVNFRSCAVRGRTLRRSSAQC